MDTVLVVVVVALVLLVAAVVVARGRGRPERPPPRSLSQALARTRHSLSARLRRALGDRALEEIEEALIAADVGAAESASITERLRAAGPSDLDTLRDLLREELLAFFAGRERTLAVSESPAVIVVVGVNGTGKTTTVAKIARHLQTAGHRPLLGAADTFRAAADTQLKSWAERLGLSVVAGSPRSDPASVAFDALEAARARGRDVVIIDTAGRLHSSHNLMQELRKIVAVLNRAIGRPPDEILLTIDAMGGQNGLVQAREFSGAVGLTGIVLTKLDGSARGGVVLAAESRYEVPVKLVGVGEEPDDLLVFEPAEFVDALLEGV